MSGLGTPVAYAGVAFVLLSTALGGATQNPTEAVELHSDGWSLSGDFEHPETPAPWPAALLLHEAFGDRTGYARLAGLLAERGTASLRIDLRAHGQSLNRGRFDPQVEGSNALMRGTDADIAAATDWLRGDPRIDADRIVVVGASYSGEFLVAAANASAWPRAYAVLSPGSFSAESMAAIDPSGIPWLIVRGTREPPFFDELFADLRAASESVEIRVIEGGGHAMGLLESVGFEESLVDWIVARLNQE